MVVLVNYTYIADYHKNEAYYQQMSVNYLQILDYYNHIVDYPHRSVTCRGTSTYDILENVKKDIKGKCQQDYALITCRHRGGTVWIFVVLCDVTSCLFLIGVFR